MNLKGIIIGVVRKLPIFSGLPDCEPKDYLSAVKEVFPNIFLSTLPIWGGAFVVIISGQVSNYWAAIGINVSHGELFLYAASFMAPVVYMAAVDPPGAGQFPSRLSHILVLIGITVLSALAFGAQKAGHKLIPTVALDVSAILFAASIFLLYIASIYQHKRLPKLTEEDFHSNENDFRKEYKGHRG